MTPLEEAQELEAAEQIIERYRKLINETPTILSILYDIDLLPEQIIGCAKSELKRINAIRMAGICEVYKATRRETIEQCAKVAETRAEDYHESAALLRNEGISIARRIRALSASTEEG